ncbi:mitochondrial import receptor subunit TOM22 homolog [Trichogramma pretiosum]|uniref:mitochondrial import receptor subunit TOM22 homolog n=1 Tax=Trichogramma pretiosum TaxID=7493 RepID=UPI0006C968BC|nr:mitochondrial import receptor subunit TOM22 homolog [Trichogramma pretiosum]
MATITEEPDQDSGMGSSDVRSPEVKSLLPHDDEEEDDEEDETLAERLIGLTEMFPEKVRNFAYDSAICMKNCVKGAYSLSCTGTWLIFSSSAILFAPLIFEIERASMQEAQRNQQKQVLLGPSSSMASGPPGFPMAPPPIQR